jgi:NADPH:quinone reductase-like Zn-dependent oxidoreductase
MSGFRRPRWRILGTELAGTVEATGTAVTQFAVGDEVFGVNAWHFGAHAEFVCMRERGPLARKPNGTSFRDAAAVCDGAILALGCLRPALVRKGLAVLIYGASGSIGTAGGSARQVL